MKGGLEGDLVKHKADRVAAGQDLDKATAIRGKEQAEYEEELANQKASFGAVSSAIPALEAGMGASSLLQQDGSGNMAKQLKHAVEASQAISAGEKDTVTAFLEGKSGAGYSPVSGEIVGILKNMKDEMEKSIKEIESSEEVAVQGFKELKAAKESEIELASEAVETKTKRVGELAVSIVTSADGIEDSTAEKGDATKFLANLESDCKTKKTEYAERTKMRTEEVSAISEAIAILNDDDALDIFKKAVLLQKGTAPSTAHKTGFLQSNAGVNAASEARLRKAAGIIASTAEFHRSQKLDFLSYMMKTKVLHAAKGAVDFGEITKMIDEMMAVLTDEQASDEKHKSWCLAELSSSSTELTNTEGKLSSLEANIGEAADEVASLADDIKSLTEKIAGLDKDVATATEQRKEDHAAYLETISLTEAAIELMGKAKNRLNKFYNPALYKAPPKKELSDEDAIVARMGGASFVQVARHSASRVSQPEAPATGTYEKKGQKSGGVLALMDMLVGELKTSLAEAQHDEKTAQGDYTELMADSEATRGSDTKSLTDKNAAKADLESKLVDLKENKALTMDELQNIHGYIAEVHGSCDFILDNFKLRADARQNEVEGLKNAKAVLAGASYS